MTHPPIAWSIHDPSMIYCTFTQTPLATDAVQPCLLPSFPRAQQRICSKVQPSNMGQNARTQNCDIVRIGFECLLLHPVTDKILQQLYVLCWNPQIIDSSSFLFSFAFCFDKENEVYQFAMCQPFTYSRHKVGYVWCMWDMCQPFTYSRHMVAYVTLLLYLMIIFPFQMILIAQSSQSMVE